VNVRVVFLTYMTAFIAGAIFKTIQYQIQPDKVADLNSTVLELTIVSVIVAGLVSIFYMFRVNQKTKDD